MPKLKLTVSLPQLDRERYLKDYKKSVELAFHAAARKFLLAVVPKIPVFTGFARGALGNLEDVVGRVQGDRVRSTLKAVTKAKRVQDRDFYYYPNGKSRIRRTNISGRRFATKSKDIFGQGQLTKATTASRMIFKFTVDISYFNYLDKNKWMAFQAGKEAFDAELKIQLVKLQPDIGKYFIRRETK